jgi:excisionase family DNA binding protein
VVLLTARRYHPIRGTNARGLRKSDQHILIEGEKMEFLTISDVAEKSGLPKPTIYRMFHELSDLIPHKRVGRKILFPEESVSKVMEIRNLTKEEGFTYEMIRERLQEPSESEGSVETEPEAEPVATVIAQRETPEELPQNISASFEGLREDLRLLAAQIDRQNDLLSRIIGRSQAYEELPSMFAQDETDRSEEIMGDGGGQRLTDFDAEQDPSFKEQKSKVFLLKLSNFWAGKGWKA